jgi:hypothetical protein
MVGSRENFLLSGRTLAEFVDKTKGEKWRYLFDILGLGTVNQLADDLQQARNALENEHLRAKALSESTARVLRGLGLEDLTDAGLLAAIQGSSGQAGIGPHSSLDAALQQDWAAAFASRATVVKQAAEFRAIADQLGAPPSMPALALLRAWNNAVAQIEGAAVSRVRLLETAKVELDRSGSIDTCPLCGQRVDQVALRKRIEEALEELRSSSRALESARRILKKFMSGFGPVQQHRRGILQRATGLGVKLPALPPDPTVILQKNLERATPVDIDLMDAESRRFKDWDAEAIKLIREASPQVSAQDEEIVNLVRLVDQGKRWREAAEGLRQAQRAHDLAERIYRAYASRQNTFMADVLSRISDQVASIYGRLHPDENLQEVTVETWGDKGVELVLDFHGVRQRPPHGVLSESHLNSLGIALFLAMAETFNEQLGFLVLDDVVNSLDVNHRGRLAELLASKYSDRQIIVLTHDHLLYEHIRRRAPSWRTLEFTSWTYEDGPRLAGYDAGGLLGKAFKELANGDSLGAAMKGRRALEELLQEACEGIGAPLPFRRGFRNDRREIGELLIGLRHTLKANKAMTQELVDLLRGVEADLQAALNVEAHASTGWASTTELADALSRVRALEQWWTCDGCGTRTWAIGNPPSTRCKCGNSIFPPPATR